MSWLRKIRKPAKKTIVKKQVATKPTLPALLMIILCALQRRSTPSALSAHGQRSARLAAYREYRRAGLAVPESILNSH